MFTSIAQDKDQVAASAGRLAGTAPGAWRDGCAAHASPSWRGIDAAGLIVEIPVPFFAKAYHPEIEVYADMASVIAAARHAGSIGVGPRIIAADPGHGLLVMELLAEGWRAATLADVAPSGKYGMAALKLRRSLHEGPKLPRTLTVFDHIEELHDALATANAHVPADYASLIETSRRIAASIRAGGHDLRPAHGDGNASNLMIHESGALRLLDYDLAANRDPYEDLASHLVEACWFASDAAVAFEDFHGHMDEKIFARVRLYGIADDLRWAMIGLILSHRSPRRNVEYLKFAEWRILRARMAIRHGDFDELLRRA